MKAQKTKSPTKALAKRKSAAPGKYIPPERRLTYEFDHVPQIDPQTRHVLVSLEQKMKAFLTLEDRIGELKDRVDEAEKRATDIPEASWHQLQFSMSTLQKELHDRVPPIERHFENLQMLVKRMDRLDKRIDGLSKEIDELRRENAEAALRQQKGAAEHEPIG